MAERIQMDDDSCLKTPSRGPLPLLSTICDDDIGLETDDRLAPSPLSGIQYYTIWNISSQTSYGLMSRLHEKESQDPDRISWDLGWGVTCQAGACGEKSKVLTFDQADIQADP